MLIQVLFFFGAALFVGEAIDGGVLVDDRSDSLYQVNEGDPNAGERESTQSEERSAPMEAIRGRMPVELPTPVETRPPPVAVDPPLFRNDGPRVIEGC